MSIYKTQLSFLLTRVYILLVAERPICYERVMEATLNDIGWRGSQEGWLEAAYQALLESGVDSVKILPLAKKLNLSRTSFYWFFKDREELLAALVARWREKIPEASFGNPKPMRRRWPKPC